MTQLLLDFSETLKDAAGADRKIKENGRAGRKDSKRIYF